jgi:hypothetical protein
MDKAVPMDFAECYSQTNGYVQEASQIEWFPLLPLKDPVQGLPAGIGQDEDRPPFVTSERQRLGCPGGIELDGERVFVLEPPETLRRRLSCSWR